MRRLIDVDVMLVGNTTFFPRLFESWKVYPIALTKHFLLLLGFLEFQAHPVLDGERQCHFDPWLLGQIAENPVNGLGDYLRHHSNTSSVPVCGYYSTQRIVLPEQERQITDLREREMTLLTYSGV
jgi:hypothetical protein